MSPGGWLGYHLKESLTAPSVLCQPQAGRQQEAHSSGGLGVGVLAKPSTCASCLHIHEFLGDLAAVCHHPTSQPWWSTVSVWLEVACATACTGEGPW